MHMTSVQVGSNPQEGLPQRLTKSMRRTSRMSSLVIFLTFGVIGGWAAFARLDSAATAPGVLANEANIQSIQHLEGGIVREILVRNGQYVEKGELLVQLDPTQSQASSKLVAGQLAGAMAKQARLEAELERRPQIKFPEEVLAEAEHNPAVRRIVADETTQFEILLRSLEQNILLLNTQIEQAEAESRGHVLRGEIAGKELVLVNADLEAFRNLREKGLANQSRLTELERSSLTLQEKIAQSEIDVARTRQSISALKLQIQQTEEAYRQRASEFLEEINRLIRGLERDKTIALDALARLDIHAPVAGTVQESSLFTLGAIVHSGDVILKIAPSSREFFIRAEIRPTDIDAIEPGAMAEITFPAFISVEHTPIKGVLRNISRDRVVDERNQRAYFEAEIALDETTVPEEISSKLVAGMEAGVIIPTGERTALEYILTPILRRFDAALTEE